MWTNQAHREFFSRSTATDMRSAGQQTVLSLIHPDDVPHLVVDDPSAYDAEPSGDRGTMLRVRDGENWRWFLLRRRVIETLQDGSPRLVVGIMVTVDELMRREAALSSELEQHTTLLGEIDHRVKNSLALVSSILSLQESATGVDLSQARRRVEAIARVHELLAHGQGFDSIDLKTHVEGIVSGHVTHGFKLSLDVPDRAISARDAVPIGLVINELVTNAWKHGVSEGGGRIEVSAAPDGDVLRFRVANDGPPLPESFRLEAGSGLGLQMVNALAHQLGGSIRVEREPLTTFEIAFPVRPATEHGTRSETR